MGLVPFLKIFCAAYILLGVSFFCCCLVHHIVLDTVSIEGAFVLSTLLTVAFFLLCGWLVVRQDLLIVCLYDCLQVFAATVIGGFGGINIGAVLAFSAIFLPQLPDDVTLSQRSWIGKCSSKDDWMIAIGCVCD